jgi:DNA-binding transcriptional LysR family regulator
MTGHFRETHERPSGVALPLLGQLLDGAVNLGKHLCHLQIIPRRIAEELVRYRPLMIRHLSVASPSIETAMIWPRGLANQPAHRWLRDIVCLATKGLRSE